MRFANNADCKLKDGYEGKITRQSPRSLFFRDTVPPLLQAVASEGPVVPRPPLKICAPRFMFGSRLLHTSNIAFKNVVRPL